MATAELALAMPAVVLVLLLVLAAVSAGVTQAARAAARQAALGSQDVTAAAVAAAGEVSVSVERGELTCVSVSRRVPGPLGGLGLTARSRACTYAEPEESS